MRRVGGSYMKALRIARDLRCPRCNLPIGQAVTAWRGRGAGDSGRHFVPTQIEPATPETHCTCKPDDDGDL